MVTQAFQKAILQWQPGKGVIFVSVFDELHNAGKDDLLRVRWATPATLEFDAVDWELEESVRWKLDLLDEKEAIKERYFASPDPLLQYGLPTSRVEDMGNHYAFRTQRAVFQQWKEDVPWAKAGEVTVANGGYIATQVGRRCETNYYGPDRCTYLLFPGEALEIHGPEALRSPPPTGGLCRGPASVGRRSLGWQRTNS